MEWKTLSSREVLKTPYLAVREERLQMPGGRIVDPYHLIALPDWVCVVCIDVEGRLVLVRQYRHGIGRTCLELPAGAIDEREAAADAARRELHEETGYESNEWHFVGSCSQDPGRHTNSASIFVARNARPTERQALDDSEDIAVQLVETQDVEALIASPAFPHAVHQAALLRARAGGFWS